MATVDKSFADNLIEGNGYYNGDSDNSMGDNPRCVRIVEYKNAFGGLSYGATFEAERDQQKYLRESEYVQSPKIYWEYKAA